MHVHPQPVMRESSAVWTIERHDTDAPWSLSGTDAGWARVKAPEGCHLAWQGRLDNRGELCRAIDSRTSSSDADVVMSLCRRDGLSRTLPRLIGDWALWFWNPRSRELSLARDFAGVCPLYYHLTPQGCWWSDSLDALISAVKGPFPLDRRYLAGLFVLGPDTAATPYEGIACVPPAHVLTIGAGRARSDPFWSPPSERRIGYRRDSDYEEHFRTLLREAVRCRLDSDGPVCALLSGGLDSSTIVCVADDLIGSGEARARTLHTITYIYDHSPTAGERAFSAEVEYRRARPSHYLDSADHRYLQPRPSDSPSVPYLLDGSVALARAQKDVMERLGCRVLLCGSGGDELLGNSRRGELVLADHLRHGELIAFARGVRDWSTSLRRPAVELLCNAVVALLRPRSRSFRAGPAHWLTPAFLDLVREPANVTRSEAHRHWPIALRAVVARTAQQDYRSWCACDVRYPFMDRRLVEFCLSIPLEQLTRPGETRSLMRRSLRGIVPDRILARRGKNLPARPIGAAIEREWERLSRLFSRPLLEVYGLACATELTQALRRARHGMETHLGSLLWAVVLEEWLQHASARQWLAPPRERPTGNVVGRSKPVRVDTLALKGGETVGIRDT